MAGLTDTIFATATGSGRAALTVIRISGPMTCETLRHLAGQLPSPRRMSLRRLRLPDSNEELDQALIVWMPGPRSYTGEDAAELHLHGGNAVLRAAAEALALLGCRPALPGEFSRRAFLNGRMDLTQAEGVADLVAAETAAQRRQALFQMQGGLRDTCDRWTRSATRLLAHQEAAIEFEMEDLPDNLCDAIRADLDALSQEIRTHLARAKGGERLREGASIAILGAPNAGKSSLLNALSGREAAIVSARAGTTRDVVECSFELHGLAVTVADTAGLRDVADEVEAEGVRRALRCAETADLVLAVFASDAVPDAATLDIASSVPNTLVVANKCDLAPMPGSLAHLRPALAVSARTGEGLPHLRDRLVEALGVQGNPSQDVLFTRPRHRAALTTALRHIDCATTAQQPEVVAEELRGAVYALASLTGAIGVEGVLDVVFSDFCIGK
jgi:tRNA modification GTPase